MRDFSVLALQMAANTTQATASGDLADLVSASQQATIYPNDDAILAVLQARFRADLPYSRIGSSNLVAVNPYKTLASLNDASARDYEERCYKDTSLPMVDSPRPLQPHLYDFAARLYLLMRRRLESQAIIARSAFFFFTFFSTHSSPLQRHHGLRKILQSPSPPQPDSQALRSHQEGDESC